MGNRIDKMKYAIMNVSTGKFHCGGNYNFYEVDCENAMFYSSIRAAKGIRTMILKDKTPLEASHFVIVEVTIIPGSIVFRDEK